MPRLLCIDGMTVVWVCMGTCVTLWYGYVCQCVCYVLSCEMIVYVAMTVGMLGIALGSFMVNYN